MARPLRIEYEGALYHVTARGNERRKTFFTRRDYEKFLEYVDEARVIREHKSIYSTTLHRSSMIFRVLITIATLTLLSCTKPSPPPTPGDGYAGSASCKECHERFHQLWETSRHRQTIRPFGDDFARASLTPQKEAVVINGVSFMVDLVTGTVTERGPQGVRVFRIEQVLGGKGLYSFLTTLPDGHIEALPVAYDIARKEWYEAENPIDCPPPPGSDALPPMVWDERPFAASDACPNCHVGQLSLQRPAARHYAIAWREPGVNCETCHGPAAEHNAAMRRVPKGQPVTDPRLVSTKTMIKARRSDLCSSCHAKKRALTGDFFPGDAYFDHFDLIALESPAFYPDGRDHGENYTLTGWRMNPCAKGDRIDCMHCHTSSGRYRFAAAEKANDACLPCHAERVAEAAQHSRHPAGSVGSRCVSCHMPATAYARMKRSDHSLRPPAPLASQEFGSPNACNLCHKDRDADWAETRLREWFPAGRRNAILPPARLIAAARAKDWSRLAAMLDYLNDPRRDEIFTASLLRMLGGCEDERATAALVGGLKDPSPLVRAAAALGLKHHPAAEAAVALATSCADESRLVRVNAAAALAAFPRHLLDQTNPAASARANREYRQALLLEPDRWSTYMTLGNLHLQRDEVEEAAEAFQSAVDLNPGSAPAHFGLAASLDRLGHREQGVTALAEVARLDPGSETTLRTIARTRDGRQALATAEESLRAELSADPRNAEAAYGLCGIVSQERLAEGIGWCRTALALRPTEPRYVATLAQLLERAGWHDEAAAVRTANAPHTQP